MASVQSLLAFNAENANKGFPYWHFEGILLIAILSKRKKGWRYNRNSSRSFV